MLKEKIEDIGKKIEKIEEILKTEEKRKEITLLEERSASPDFWKDSKGAKEVMQNLSRMKKSISEFDELKKRYNDSKILFNEDEPEILEEIEEEIETLEENIKKMSFDLKLSGPHDSKNAIVILHSGAGGTEACDWCEMLLRLYSRWSERKGYAREIVDILPGEEAGIKRATFIIKGDYAYGYENRFCRTFYFFTADEGIRQENHGIRQYGGHVPFKMYCDGRISKCQCRRINKDKCYKNSNCNSILIVRVFS